MQTLQYQCVDCRSAVASSGGRLVCSGCGRVFDRHHGVDVLWPTAMDDLAHDEAEHHDHDESDAVEVHQLDRPRNRQYHELLWSWISAVPAGETLLEIGAGTGYDAKELVAKYSIVLSDVSPETLHRTMDVLGHDRVAYVAADGSHLPFADHQFGGVYMVATLHHLPSPTRGIEECARVLKSGGLLAIAIEPNATYFRVIKRLRHVLCRFTHMRPEEGSHADAEMEGFTYRDWQRFFPRDTWSDVTIVPVWFTAGYWHYAAEFLYRALRLSHRLVLPGSIERALVAIDRRLFRLPGMKHLAWHWMVVARKR